MLTFLVESVLMADQSSSKGELPNWRHYNLLSSSNIFPLEFRDIQLLEGLLPLLPSFGLSFKHNQPVIHPTVNDARGFGDLDILSMAPPGDNVVD